MASAPDCESGDLGSTPDPSTNYNGRIAQTVER